MADVSREDMNKLASMLGFKIPDKGDNYVRPMGRSRGSLLLVLTRKSDRAQLVTHGSQAPLVFHADTLFKNKGWKRTLIRKVHDANVKGAVNTAQRLHNLFVEMKTKMAAKPCPRCKEKRLSVYSSERGGFYTRCGACDKWLPLSESMGTIEQSVAEVSKDENLYEILTQKPSDWQISQGVKVLARWEDYTARNLIILGSGTRFCRLAFRAFGLHWDKDRELWIGPGRTQKERTLLRKGIEANKIETGVLDPERIG